MHIQPPPFDPLPPERYSRPFSAIAHACLSFFGKKKGTLLYKCCSNVSCVVRVSSMLSPDRPTEPTRIKKRRAYKEQKRRQQGGEFSFSWPNNAYTALLKDPQPSSRPT